MVDDQYGKSMNIDNPNDFKIFENWKLATDFSLGYENIETIGDYKKQIASAKPWERKKSIEVTERELQLIGLFSLIINDKKLINIIDLGGGNGYMCHLLRLWFPLLEINYTIWESPSMANAYREYEELSRITWTSEIPKNRFDIAITSGTLQYLEFPEKYLREITAIASELVILRFPELNGPKSKYAAQVTRKINISSSYNTWPIRFFGKGELESMLPTNTRKNLEFFHHDEVYLFDDEKVMLKGFHYSIV
jgi:putative methyltransferase (TIGR04325 family)